ncbi:CCA tRNA nucleotidyltransferase [Gorillibacterium sp. sgz5001074]|uniref:CCA tRNA nucleotidyltransferase n=1 Tax=Gorillibacterium sp. sgz5001074 TaxID=3446695 RepID=UPI003F66B38E
MTEWNKLEQKGLTVLEALEAAGHEAFFVGGYVRDKLLGKPVKDIDIATSALPDEVVGLFKKTIPTGLKHGTVTVMQEGEPFEVTTYRTESGYEDFRRPSEVQFISELEEDLRRRDFTINAMAMDRHGLIRDPFGGRDDLQRGVLRCVGQAEDRFQEDALRMMRCVRFASTYALQVDPATWEAVLLRKELLRHVAMERVRVELDRMLAGGHPYRGIKLLLDSGLLTCTKEALNWTYTGMTEEEAPAGLSVLDRLEAPLHRWMLLMLLVSLDPDEARQLMRGLTFSVKDMERIAKVLEISRWVRAHCEAEWPHTVEEVPACSLEDAWKLAVLRYGKEAGLDWLSIEEGLHSEGIGRASCVPELLRHGAGWLQAMPAAGLKELALAGQDLIRQAGRPAGPWVSRTMAALLKLAALGRVANVQADLLACAAELEKEGGTQ